MSDSSSDGEVVENVVVEHVIVRVVDYSKPFTKRIDPTLIYPPRETPPDHYVQGKDPYWKSFEGCPDQLMDPSMNNSSIGFWDDIKSKAFIFGFGYLHRCKKRSNLSGTFWDPDTNPFDEGDEEGKIQNTY